mgnify:FL=1
MWVGGWVGVGGGGRAQLRQHEFSCKFVLWGLGQAGVGGGVLQGRRKVKAVSVQCKRGYVGDPDLHFVDTAGCYPPPMCAFPLYLRLAWFAQRLTRRFLLHPVPPGDPEEHSQHCGCHHAGAGGLVA